MKRGWRDWSAGWLWMIGMLVLMAAVIMGIGSLWKRIDPKATTTTCECHCDEK